MYIFKTKSANETFSLGAEVAKRVTEGDVICLAGNLGVGKTVFVQGMASSLEILDPVTSPTFNLLNVYEARFPVYHFDLYRLDHTAELADVGFYEYAYHDGGLSIIEWPDKFPDELPDYYLWIEIKIGEHYDERVLSFRPKGTRYEKLCEELKLINDSSFRYSDPSV